MITIELTTASLRQQRTVQPWDGGNAMYVCSMCYFSSLIPTLFEPYRIPSIKRATLSVRLMWETP
jgi:hypothetical protein